MLEILLTSGGRYRVDNETIRSIQNAVMFGSAGDWIKDVDGRMLNPAHIVSVREIETSE